MFKISYKILSRLLSRSLLRQEAKIKSGFTLSEMIGEFTTKILPCDSLLSR